MLLLDFFLVVVLIVSLFTVGAVLVGLHCSSNEDVAMCGNKCFLQWTRYYIVTGTNNGMKIIVKYGVELARRL